MDDPALRRLIHGETCDACEGVVRASDDALRRQIEARLSEGRLPTVHGVSKSHRGTGRPCIVCRRTIGPTDVEREVESQGVFFHAHEACYKPWREESVARRVATGRELGRERARGGGP